MSNYEKALWALAGLALLPVIINPASWVLAVALAAGIILVGYGGRFAVRQSLEIEKARRTGEKASTGTQARNLLTSGDGDGSEKRWER